MAILDEVIRNAMRVRIINSGIVSADDFQFENRNFDPKRREYWLRETWLGGEEELLTNSHIWIAPAPLLQYDVFVRPNTGTLKAGQIINAIEEEFDITNLAKSRIAISNMPELQVDVTKTRMDSAQEDDWYSQKILLYMRIFKRG